MKIVSLTELRSDIYNLIDEVLETGVPLQLQRDGKTLLISPILDVPRTKRLVRRPDAFKGDADDLLDMNWEKEVKLDLP